MKKALKLFVKTIVPRLYSACCCDPACFASPTQGAIDQLNMLVDARISSTTTQTFEDQKLMFASVPDDLSIAEDFLLNVSANTWNKTVKRNLHVIVIFTLNDLLHRNVNYFQEWASDCVDKFGTESSTLNAKVLSFFGGRSWDVERLAHYLSTISHDFENEVRTVLGEWFDTSVLTYEKRTLPEGRLP